MQELPAVSQRIKRLCEKRDYTNSGHMRINTERTKLYTEYYVENEAQYPILKRAGAMHYWCKNSTTPVADEDILVGSLAPDYRAINFYVEWEASWLDKTMNDTDDNFRRAWQAPGAVYMSDEERQDMKAAAQYWNKHNIPAHMRGIVPDEIWNLSANGANNLEPRDGFMSIGSKPQGHYIAGFDRAVNVGFGQVRMEALRELAVLDGRIFGSDARRHAFYRAAVTVCDAAILLAKRYAAACRKKADGADAQRRAELLRMADSLEWIMENPARTYWEGLQAILLYQMMLSTDAQQHGQSYGRIDKYVGHLLERELRDGTITIEQAQEYTDAFILRSGDFLVMDIGVPNDAIISLNERGKSLYSILGQHMTLTSGLHLTVGGQNADGSDATNEASYMIIRSYARLCVPDPTAAVRIHPGTPDDLWELAIESSKRAGGMPQFQNDEIIIPMLVSRGLSVEDARGYSIVGCVEPAGTGNEWPACGNSGHESIWSLAGCVVHAINGGVHPRNGTRGLPCKQLYEYESFDEFKDEVARQARYFLDWHISICSLYEQVYSQSFPCITASVMMDGCMESGLDATWGGCKYNSTGITCIGTANVGDSLMAIKQLCFDEKSVTLREMHTALLDNWVGHEDLRQRIINEVPHYGNASEEVDALAAWGLSIFAQHLQTRSGPRGRYCGGTFTMIAHLHYGGMTPATPDGRADGDPLADAISPRQGFDKNGPTAYLKSAAGLPHSELWNGDQLNIRFSPSSVQGEGGNTKLRQLIETYFEMSGMQVQFNVVSTEQLHKAQENPTDYKNMVVRIAGFSAYFVELNRNMQDDFITRTEQSL